MSYTINPNKSCSCDELCINSENVNPAFQETFRFLQHYQETMGIEPSNCVLTLKTSLLKNENNQTPPPIPMTTNTIQGKVKKVHSTFVELSFPNLEKETFTYAISYENIITLSSPILLAHYESYLRFMSKVPPLCKNAPSSTNDLLQQLQKLLTNKALAQEYLLSFIPSGILSPSYDLSEIILVRNLIFVEKNLIIPFYQLNGYVLKPIVK